MINAEGLAVLGRKPRIKLTHSPSQGKNRPFEKCAGGLVVAKSEKLGSGAPDPVPCSRFDYRNFPAERRLAEFRHVTASLYDTWAIGAEEDFRVEAIGYRVDELIFTRVAFSPARFIRNERHIEGAERGYLVLQHQYAGSELLMSAHGNLRIDAGNLYLRDWSYPFESHATQMQLDSIIIPRRRLHSSALLEADHPVLSLSATGPGGRMLAEIWSDLFSRFGEVSLGDAEALCQAFLGFLDGLLGHGEHAKPSKTLRSMERFLVVRLRQDVGVEDLCRHFHVSRTQVFRLFQPHGGVQAFLKRLRLERCHAELLTADPSRTRVRDVAASWLFDDPSLFSRQFRSMFGRCPSRVVGEGRASWRHPPDSREGEPLTAKSYDKYRTWLSQAAKHSRGSDSGARP